MRAFHLENKHVALIVRSRRSRRLERRGRAKTAGSIPVERRRQRRLPPWFAASAGTRRPGKEAVRLAVLSVFAFTGKSELVVLARIFG
jgi:hypothetical protein